MSPKAMERDVRGEIGEKARYMRGARVPRWENVR